jgi:serine/threonine protein phosphatase PrpC
MFFLVTRLSKSMKKHNKNIRVSTVWAIAFIVVCAWGGSVHAWNPFDCFKCPVAAAPATRVEDIKNSSDPEYHEGVVWAAISLPSLKDQDEYAIPDDDAVGRYLLFGIYDGHGKYDRSGGWGENKGKQVAQYVKRRMCDLCCGYLCEHSDDDMRDLLNMFHLMHGQINAEIISQPGLDTAGSTATTVLIDRKLRTITIAHTGDSLCIIWDRDKKVQYATLAHTPECDEELVRVYRAGGCVTKAAGSWRVNGLLEMTRSFGDAQITCEQARDLFLARQKDLGEGARRGMLIPIEYETQDISSVSDGTPIVSSEPDVTTIPFPDGGKIVLASDGLWNTVNAETIAEIANESGIEHVAYDLREEAASCGVRDDVSVIAIFLPHT